MADDIPVTVNIVGNLAPLKTTLAEAAALPAIVKEVQIKTTNTATTVTEDISAGIPKSAPAQIDAAFDGLAKGITDSARAKAAELAQRVFEGIETEAYAFSGLFPDFLRLAQDNLAQLRAGVASAPPTVTPNITETLTKSSGGLGNLTGDALKDLDIPLGPMGKLIGEGGKLSGVMAKLGPAFAAAGPAIAAVAVALVGVAAVVAAAAVAFHVLKEAINAATEAQLKYAKMSGQLGSLKGAVVAVEGIELAVRGTGVDKDSLLALTETLTLRAREQLLEGPGLDLLVKASARLDPSKAGEYGSAIGAALDSIATSPNSMEGPIEKLNQMGLITDKAARAYLAFGAAGANAEQRVDELNRILKENANGADGANNSMGALMDKLQLGISSTWSSMLEKMGGKIAEKIGPGFGKLTAYIGQFIPKLMQIAEWIGEVLGSLASWVGGALEAAANGLNMLIGMFKSGDIKMFAYLGLAWAFTKAVDLLINGVAIGLEFAAYSIMAPFKLIANGDFWSGVGNILKGLGLGLVAIFMGLGATLFNALNPILNWFGAVFELIGHKLGMTVMSAVKYLPASLLGGEAAKDKIWNKTKEEDKNPLTLQRIKERREQDGSNENANVDAAAELTVEMGKEAADLLAKGLGQATTAGKDASQFTQDYKTPDLLSGAADNIARGMAGIAADNFTMPKPKPEEEEKRKKLGDVTAQGGPNSVVDSLQAVGGGGNAAGMSIEEKILDENKKQNEKLGVIAGKTIVDKVDVPGMFSGFKNLVTPDTKPKKSFLDTVNVGGMFGEKGKPEAKPKPTSGTYDPVAAAKIQAMLDSIDAPASPFGLPTTPVDTQHTGNVVGAYGSANGGEGASATTLLTSINSTLVSILNAIVNGGGKPSSSVGGLVTTRS